MHSTVRVLHRNGKRSFSFYEYAGFPAFELANTCILISQQASGVLSQAGFFVQVNKEIPLVISRGDGMRDFISDPPAPGIHGGIGQVDAVARVGKLVSSFGHDFNRQGDIVETAPAAKTSSSACQGDGDSAGGVDPAPFRAG